MSKLVVTIDEFSYEIDLGNLSAGDSHFQINVDGEMVEVLLYDRLLSSGTLARMIIDGRPYEVSLDRELNWIHSQWGLNLLEIQDLDVAVSRPTTGDGRVKAPIPGQISQILVTKGDEVRIGQPLLILEAMKMENEIRAPQAGSIESINVQIDQIVSLNQVLLEIE